MTSAALGVAGKSSRREAVVAGVIGNVLEWYDFAVYGYFVPVISQLFFPDQNEYKSLLTTLAPRVSPAFAKATARQAQTRLQRQHERLANFPKRNPLGSFS